MEKKLEDFIGNTAWSNESELVRMCSPICERILSVCWNKSTEAYFLIRYSTVSKDIRVTYGDFYKVQLKELGRVVNAGGAQLYMPAGRDARFRDNSNTVQVTVDTKLGKARLGPIGNILVEGDLRDHRLGRFLLTEVITWLKLNYPGLAIAKGDLRFGDATEDNIDRRDQFYRGAGLTIEYTHKKSDGKFFIDRIENLTPYCPINMKLISPENLATRLLLAEESNTNNQKRVISAQKSIEKDLRLLGKCMYFRDRFAAALVALLLLFTYSAYRNWSGFKNWIGGLF